MSGDFLSGLLLTGVVLFGIGYIVKEFFWESLSDLMSRRAPPPPARRPNDHLIGATARVVDDGATSGVVRVRVGMETWRARTVDADSSLPIGTLVEIKAVDGLVLDVAQRNAAEQQTT